MVEVGVRIRFMPEEVDLWAELDFALSLNTEYEKKGVDSEDEDEYGNNLLIREADAVDSTMIRLDDGDIHLCDKTCSYAFTCKLTGDLVCPFSGMCVGNVASERTDYSTGRNTWSIDPDMANATNGANGGWRKKVDNATASKQAHRMSTQLDDSVMPVESEPRKSQTLKIKRGALCVDEAEDALPVFKKPRMSKKKVQSNEQINGLVAEASLIFGKLTHAKKNVLKSTNQGVSNNLHVQQTISFDKRLLNSEALFSSALNRYLKTTLEGGSIPCIDEIHNIALAVDEIVSDTRRKMEEFNRIDALRFKSTRFREVVARLAISLWRGICQTPYMRKARRGGDSFRPFCVGIFYSLKRGLTLSDGTVLVPSFDSFHAAFPSAKEIAADPTTKNLHASSHRGLCSIHRCIASIDIETQHTLFASALRLVPELSTAR